MTAYEIASGGIASVCTPSPDSGYELATNFNNKPERGNLPAIHPFSKMLLRRLMDTRVKPAYDN
jgi:hypothetical protein